MKLTKKQKKAFDMLSRYTNYRSRFIIEDVPEKTFDGNELYKMYKNEEVDIIKIKPILRTFLDLAKPTEIVERGEKKTFIPAISIAESHFKPYIAARSYFTEYLRKDNLEFEITEVKPAGEVSKATKEALQKYEALLSQDSTLIPPKLTYDRQEMEQIDKSIDLIIVSVKGSSYMSIRLMNDRKKNNFSISGEPIKEINMANILSFYHWLHNWQFATQIADNEFISFDKAKELGYNITGEK